jgi:protoporphyrinogen oxidase
MRVAIIGAGVTGLSLADHLSAAGAEVELFERGNELGGLAAGFEVLPGIRLERFYHHIFQTDVDIQNLMADLGMRNRIMWRPANVGFFLDEKVHRLSTPVDVLRFKPLDLWGRIGLATTMLELRERRHPKAFDRATVEQYFRRRLAGSVYRKVWAPMYEAKWGSDARDISAAWMWQKVRARGKSRRGLHEELGYPVGGFGSIARGLADRVRLQRGKLNLNTVVNRIRTGDGRVTGIDTDNASLDFDAIVSTLPLVNLLPLVPQLPQGAANACRAIGYRGVVCHVIVMDRPLSNIYWLNNADRSIPLGGIVEQTNFVSPENYNGKHIAYLFSYLDQEAPELTMSEDDFVAHHFPHVKRIFPNFSPDHVERRFVFRTRVASPIYKHPYRPPPLEPMPGLWLADTSRIFPMDRGTSECLRLARYVAARVLGRPARPPGPV